MYHPPEFTLKDLSQPHECRSSGNTLGFEKMYSLLQSMTALSVIQGGVSALHIFSPFLLCHLLVSPLRTVIRFSMKQNQYAAFLFRSSAQVLAAHTFAQARPLTATASYRTNATA